MIEINYGYKDFIYKPTNNSYIDYSTREHHKTLNNTTYKL